MSGVQERQREKVHSSDRQGSLEMSLRRGNLCAEPGVEDVHQAGEEERWRRDIVPEPGGGTCPVDSCGVKQGEAVPWEGPWASGDALCGCQRLGCQSQEQS